MRKKRKSCPEGAVKLTITVSPSTNALVRKVAQEMNVTVSSVVEYCLEDTLRSRSDVAARQMVLAYRRVMKSVEASETFGAVPNGA